MILRAYAIRVTMLRLMAMASRGVQDLVTAFAIAGTIGPLVRLFNFRVMGFDVAGTLFPIEYALTVLLIALVPAGF